MSVLTGEATASKRSAFLSFSANVQRRPERRHRVFAGGVVKKPSAGHHAAPAAEQFILIALVSVAFAMMGAVGMLLVGLRRDE